MRRPAAEKTTSDSCSGNNVAGAAAMLTLLSIPTLRSLLDGKSGRVQREHDRNQNETECEGEWKVALACFERDRRRHDARDAIDVAADNDHRAYLAGGAAEACHHDGEQREAEIP